MTSQNQTERKLAVILFADIAGYTAMMQSDEGKTMNRLRHYQQILSEKTKEHKGEIVKNYGDGSLCLFTSVLGAVNCAKDLQEMFLQEPKVPLRIGIHIGDVMYEANDIYGDSINVASRIESMGIPGSVLMSRDVYKKVKNQSSLQFKELGSFEFKNVEEPMEVYVLANQGLAIPDIDNITGKFKSKTAEDEPSYFQKIWKKKIPQILIAYIMLAWIGLQVFDWGLMQFGISPHWAQIFFITVLGIIPSLLVYLNNKERIHQSSLNLGEKILFPSNFAIIGSVLYFMFNTVDLGAISKNITFLNADGVEVTETIVKDEFRKRFPIFPFDPIKEDSANAWIGLSIVDGIKYQLNQNTYLSAIPIYLPRNRLNEPYTTIEKMNRSKIWNEDYYVDGQFQVNDSEYEIIPALRNKKTSKVISEKRFVGEDYFSLVDSVSLFIKQAVGLTKFQIESTPDLKMSETFTDNMDAFKHYAMYLAGIGNPSLALEKAIALDSTFTLAFLNYSIEKYVYSRGQLETKLAIDQAMRHRKRLNFSYRIAVMVQKHLIYEEWDKAEKLIKIQLELEPNNEGYNFRLSNVYTLTGQIDKLVSHTEKRFADDPNPNTSFQAMRALLMNGEPEMVINRVKKFLLLDPQHIGGLMLLAEAYIHNNNLTEAKTTIEKITLINPDVAIDVNKTMEAIEYMESNPTTNAFLSKFVGVYRAGGTEMLIELRILGNHIHMKANNQSGFFMYPGGENLLKYGTSNQRFSGELLFNPQGEVYGIKQTQGAKGREWTHMTWKQDSVIWNAENLLRQGKYNEAYKAYKKAIAENPEHYYLTQHLQHLIYLRNHSDEDIQKNLQRMTGQYGVFEIWLEKGLLYIKTPGWTRRILRPISDNRFTTLLRYKNNFEFVEKDGKIVAIQPYDYKSDTKEWELDPNWYYERTEFLD